MTHSVHFAKVLEGALDALTAEMPCGPSLRYAPVMGQIREARSEDDPSLPMGGWVRPLKKADWKSVETLALDVLTHQSKDLQVAAWLTEAWVHLHGIDGFIAGISLLRDLCARYWDQLHPVYDSESAEMRSAPFVWLNDSLALTLLLHLPIIPWPDHAHAFISLNQWQTALTKEFGTKGISKPEEPVSISRNQILAAAADHLAALVLLDNATEQALADWFSLASLLDGHLSNEAPSLAKVANILGKLRLAIRSILSERDPRDDVAPEAVLSPTTMQTPIEPLASPHTTMTSHSVEPANPAAAATVAALTGPINSRDDAYRMLETAAAYLARTEPHSPTPYLVKRAVTWGKLSLPALMQEVLREDGDINRYFSMLGIKTPH